MKGCAKCMELHCTFDRPMTPSEHSKSQSESNALALEEEAFSGKREREREGERGLLDCELRLHNHGLPKKGITTVIASQATNFCSPPIVSLFLAIFLLPFISYTALFNSPRSLSLNHPARPLVVVHDTAFLPGHLI